MKTIVLRVLLLAVLVAAGCASNRVNWDERIGVLTYDQAVRELGPPDAESTLSDGTRVAQWRGRARAQTVHTGIHQSHWNSRSHWRRGTGMGTTVVVPADNAPVLRLTFGPDGRLAEARRL